MAAGSAALALGAACTTFGLGNTEPADAGPAPDTSIGPDPSACTAGSLPAPIDCGAGCAPEQLFDPLDTAVVSANSLYYVRNSVLYQDPDISTGLITKLGTSAIEGKALKMAVDDEYVYVSTDMAHARVSKRTALKEPAASGGDLHPLVLGNKVYFQLQPQLVLQWRKDGVDSPQSQAVVGADALAVDGDAAYWIGLNGGIDHVIVGPFGSPKAHGVVKAPVLGFAVAGGYAYVAEKDGTSTASTIARFSLESGERKVLIMEPGAIVSLDVHAGRLYWVARRQAEGTRVFASSDLCGGSSRVHANQLAPIVTLSFGTNYVYAAGVGPGPLYRIKN